MPSYLTGLELLSEGAATLARLAGPEDAPELDAAPMRAALEGADLVALGYPPDVVDAATQAVAVILAAIDRAEATLEQALRGVYALPLNPVDSQVKGLVRDLARYYLHRAGIPEDVAARAEQARQDLERLARRDSQLSAALEPAAGSAGMPAYTAPDSAAFPVPEGW